MSFLGFLLVLELPQDLQTKHQVTRVEVPYGVVSFHSLPVLPDSPHISIRAKTHRGHIYSLINSEAAAEPLEENV